MRVCGRWHRFPLWPVVLLLTPAVAQTTYTPYAFTTAAGAPAIGAADGTGAAASFNRSAAVAVDSAGNTYVADTGNNAIRRISPSGTVTTLAGSPGSTGTADGTGAAARFNNPAGVAVDGAGNVYVADTRNHTIRKVTPAGVVTTLAGSPGTAGFADGTGAGARLNFPSGVVVDGAGNVYVTDSGNNVIRKITPGGVVTTLAGTGMLPSQGTADGTGAEARFNTPHDTAVDTAGNVYVTDALNHTIRKITPAGAVTTFAGQAGIRGTADGTGTAAQFDAPNGLTVDASGNVFVADTINCTIRKITPAGVVTTLAGAPGVAGSADGTGGAATFFTPGAVAVDSGGNVYVADTGNNTIRKVTSAGVVTTLAGQAGVAGVNDGTGTAALFATPTGLTIDGTGNLYVPDPVDDTIRKITPAGVVTTPIGVAGTLGSVDGTGTAARFNSPHDVTVDGSGNLFVADSGNETIRMITPAGVVTTLAGQAGVAGHTDGTGSAALFDFPNGLSVDTGGNIYVADSNTNLIRKVTSAGVVTTLAGSAGNVGYADGTGTAAQFSDPTGLTFNSAGNLLVADTGNFTIRQVTPAGVVTTAAGSATDRSNLTRDGSVVLARFNSPGDVAIDSVGNIYVADTGNNTVRQITTGGIVSTLAGNAGTRGMADGVGSAGLLNGPEGLAIDSAGVLHVADTFNNAIRKVAPDGTVVTLAGFGLAGSKGSADGVGTAARFNEPTSLAVDALGNLYVTDAFNFTIRKIAPDGTVSTRAGTAGVTGGADGVGAAASFFLPYGMTVDSSGNLFVADIYNAVIRKVAPDGTVTTFAGTAGSQGSADGTGGAASFSLPSSVATDSAGNVYVADRGNSLIRKITAGGTVTTLAGLASAAGFVDGTGTAARFNGPAAVATDSAGNVFVADTGNNVIRKVTPAGTVTTLAGSRLNAGAKDGTGINAWFSSPSGLTVDSGGNVFVTDTGNNLIRRVTPAGVVTTLGGIAGLAGSTDGEGSAALFNAPNNVVVDSAGNLYVADTFNNTIRRGQRGGLPAITTQPVGQTAALGQGVVFTVAAGSSSSLTYQWQMLSYGSSTWTSLTDGASFAGTGTATLTVNASTAAMNGSSFRCVVTNATGSVATLPVPLIVAGSLAVNTLAGQAGQSGSSDATGTAARFLYLSDVAVDPSGNVYVADTNNHTIRKITPAGVVTTLAGTAGASGSIDGTGSAARFNHPSGVAADTSGTVYVSDTNNNTIRAVTSAGVVTTLAGMAGTVGSADGGGSAAQWHGPSGIVFDPGTARLYVADTLNHTIRALNLSGIVSTLAGQAGANGSADGTGTAATFYGPQGLAVDTSGHLYVADTNNNLVRKIVIANASVSTVAGQAGSAGSADGVGSAARFYFPSGVAVDPAGDVYVADTENHTIREISPTGVVTTQAGQVGISGSTDGLGTAARFYFPTGIVADSGGTIYIADTNNYTVRVALPPVAPTITVQPQGATVIAGSGVQFSVVATGNPTYQWSLNGTAISGATSSTYSLTSAQSSNAGDYTVTVTNSYGSATSNKATLTVDAASTSSGSSEGGGGAIGAWVAGALALLGLARCYARKS